MNLLIAPFINALFAFYYLTGNLGWSVVLVTVIIRIVLLPLLVPSLKSAKRMRELQPKLKRLQEKYGSDKKGLAEAQMNLYKEEGVNPLSGCLPQILQIAVLILFFSAFNMVGQFSAGNGNREALNANLMEVFKMKEDFKFGVDFLGSNLTMTPAGIFKEGLGAKMILPLILLLGSGVLQYLSSKLMMPAVEVDKKIVEKTKDKEDDLMGAMRTQSMYMMPLMTVIIGWSFNLGLLLYWFVNSGVMLGQQVVMERMKKI